MTWRRLALHCSYPKSESDPINLCPRILTKQHAILLDAVVRQTFFGKFLSADFSSFTEPSLGGLRSAQLWYGRDWVEGWSHLWEDFVEPLQWTIEVDLNPARCAGHILAMVLGSPTLHKTHPNRAHLGQFEDSAVAVVYRLKLHHHRR